MTLKQSSLPLLFAALLAGCSPSEKSLTVFKDITAQSGLAAYEGMTPMLFG